MSGRVQDAAEMDPQYARLDAIAFALRRCLELRARACAEHSAGNAVHELQAARCKHLWVLTVKRMACTLYTQISAKSVLTIAGSALTHKYISKRCYRACILAL